MKKKKSQQTIQLSFGDSCLAAGNGLLSVGAHRTWVSLYISYVCIFFPREVSRIATDDAQQDTQHTRHIGDDAEFLSRSTSHARRHQEGRCHTQNEDSRSRAGNPGKWGEGTLRAILISCYLKSSQPLETGERGLAGNLYRRTQPEHWEESSPTRGRTGPRKVLAFVFARRRGLLGGSGEERGGHVAFRTMCGGRKGRRLYKLRPRVFSSLCAGIRLLAACDLRWLGRSSPHDHGTFGRVVVYLFGRTMSSSRNDDVRHTEAGRQAAV